MSFRIGSNTTSPDFMVARGAASLLDNRGTAGAQRDDGSRACESRATWADASHRYAADLFSVSRSVCRNAKAIMVSRA